MSVVTTFEALLSEYTWNGLKVAGRPVFLTFSFDLAASSAPDGRLSPAFLASFRAFSESEQELARRALATWADASGVTFFEVGPGQGDLRFGAYDFTLGPPQLVDFVAFAYLPYVIDFIDGAWEEDWGGNMFFDNGSVDFEILLHEIGHALGLEHPFEGTITLDASVDSTDQTIMSYTVGVSPVTGLGPLDVQAIQFLYGPASADGAQAASWSWDPVTMVLTQSGGDAGDRLAGVAVADRIRGEGGDDYIMARGGADSVDGGPGNDTIAGGDGADTVLGGEGDDILDGDNGDDILFGGAGDDELWGMSGADTLQGEDGDDYLSGGTGSNRLFGGRGADTLVVGSGSDTIDGGEGDDELWFIHPTNASASLSYASFTAGGGLYTSIEAIAIFGGAGDDTIQGGHLPDYLFGGAGADSISGGAAADELFGAAGADTLSGGDGPDVLAGGAGDDWLIPGPGADDIWGGAGVDTVDYSTDLAPVDVTINQPRSVGGVMETMAEVENLVGSPYADRIRGDGGDNRLFGGAGADTIHGGDGANYLRGDEGADSLVGGAGFDDINGNMGDDTASGGLGDDWVVGGKDQDLLFGDEGDDIVYGNLGDDTLDGGAGNDVVRGGQGSDILTGGAGDDFLSGDRGDDTLTGGAGADIFHIFAEAGIERVTDFDRTEGDRVMLAPGSQYAVSQVGADTVISLAGGAQMILVGVTMSSLTGDWIFGA